MLVSKAMAPSIIRKRFQSLTFDNWGSTSLRSSAKSWLSLLRDFLEKSLFVFGVFIFDLLDFNEFLELLAVYKKICWMAPRNIKRNMLLTDDNFLLSTGESNQDIRLWSSDTKRSSLARAAGRSTKMPKKVGVKNIRVKINHKSILGKQPVF